MRGHKMIRIENGSSCFYQWDTNRRLLIENNNITEVHFSNAVSSAALVCEVYEENGKRLVNVPNILLQTQWTLRVYGCCAEYVRESAEYIIISRKKPDDYIYTETEVKRFETLEAEVREAAQKVEQEVLSCQQAEEAREEAEAIRREAELDRIGAETERADTFRSSMNSWGKEVNDTVSASIDAETERANAFNSSMNSWGNSVNNAVDSAENAAGAANDAVTALTSAAHANAIKPEVKDNIICFTDGAAAPTDKVVSYIEPKQSGMGEPSPDNVREISGWNGVSLIRCGKNLLPSDFVDGDTKTENGITFTDNKDGTVSVNGTAAITATYKLNNSLTLKPDEVYYLSGEKDGVRTALYYRNEKGNDAYHNTISGGLLWKKEYQLVFLYIGVPTGCTANDVLIKPCVSVGKAEDYEPYKGDTYTVDFDETVYGGEYNWTTGELMVTHAIQAFTGAEPLTQSKAVNGNPRWCISLTTKAKPVPSNQTINALCNMYQYRSADRVYMESEGLSIDNTGGLAVVYDTDLNNIDLNGFKAYLTAQYEAGTPVILAYELAEPNIIQLTPQQIQTYFGTNTLYSDSGDTEIKYIADTKTYIDNKFNELATALVAMGGI